MIIKVRSFYTIIDINNNMQLQCLKLQMVGQPQNDQMSYDFLLPFHCNYGPILFRFPHIARYWWLNIKIYIPHTGRVYKFCDIQSVFNAAFGSDPVGIAKTFNPRKLE